MTNRIFGIPIFLLLMYFMFMLTFDWLGFPLSDLLDAFIYGPLTAGIQLLLSFIGASAFIHDLIIEGIVAGVGGVLVFVPQIFILFFFISLLEDSGYMARVALVMDRIMDSVGLNGKAFIPMIIGFGCNVPGIMAARTIETPKERLLTTLLTPLMSCSARLPIYALFAGAFFKENKAIVVLSLYVLGVVLALILAMVFSKTILKGENWLFVIELPPYRYHRDKHCGKVLGKKEKVLSKKRVRLFFQDLCLFGYYHTWDQMVSMLKWGVAFLALIGGIFAPLFSTARFWKLASCFIIDNRIFGKGIGYFNDEYYLLCA